VLPRRNPNNLDSNSRLANGSKVYIYHWWKENHRADLGSFGAAGRAEGWDI
jgi:hypothetical protein